MEGVKHVVVMMKERVRRVEVEMFLQWHLLGTETEKSTLVSVMTTLDTRATSPDQGARQTVYVNNISEQCRKSSTD